MKNGMRAWSAFGTVIGACLGLALGWFFGPKMEAVKWIGDLFLGALKFVLLPLVMSALVVGVSGLGDVRKLGKFGGLTIAYFLITTAIAVGLGLLLVILIQPGVGFTVSEAVIPDQFKVGSGYSFGDFILSFLGGGDPGGPNKTNIFYSLTHMEMLPVILFSLVLGAVLTTLGEKGKPVLGFFQGLYEALMKIILGIIWFAPIGVFGLVASKLGGLGGGEMILRELGKVGMYTGTVLLGLFIHGFIVLPLILHMVGKRSPVAFFRGMIQALVTAFSTGSSAATLPLTTQNVISNNEVSERSANFVLPIGATVNMNGTALYEGVAVVFIAQALGIQLTVGQIFLILILATFAAIAAAAIPEAGLVTMVMILQAVHLPIEAIGMLLAVDWFLDRCRTTINVWGDTVGAAVMDRFQRVVAAVKLEAV